MVSAAGEDEIDVVRGLDGSPGDALPAQEANGKPVLAAADFGIDIAWRRKGDTQQLGGRAAIEGVLEKPVASDLGLPLGAFPGQPENLGDGVEQGLDTGEPALEVFHPAFIRQAEPVLEIRQIEFAGTPGNGAAMFDGA